MADARFRKNGILQTSNLHSHVFPTHPRGLDIRHESRIVPQYNDLSELGNFSQRKDCQTQGIPPASHSCKPRTDHTPGLPRDSCSYSSPLLQLQAILRPSSDTTTKYRFIYFPCSDPAIGTQDVVMNTSKIRTTTNANS